MAGRASIVVFDLGGVLIDWNPRYLYRKLFDGDDAAMETFLTAICSPAWNETFDAGRRFADGIAELVAEHPQEKARIEAYFARWAEMVKGPIDGTVALLEHLHGRGTPLYALTNWSSETLPMVRGREPYGFLDRFRDIVVSGELGLIKPDPAIFRVLLSRIGAPPEQCLFIDDAPRNVAAAEALGFHVHRFTSPDGLRGELDRHGLL